MRFALVLVVLTMTVAHADEDWPEVEARMMARVHAAADSYDRLEGRLEAMKPQIDALRD